jgi:hypothetical protein
MVRYRFYEWSSSSRFSLVQLLMCDDEGYRKAESTRDLPARMLLGLLPDPAGMRCWYAFPSFAR